MHLSLTNSAEDALFVMVPAGHGEHWVQRLMLLSMTTISLWLDHTMIFHTDDAPA